MGKNNIFHVENAIIRYMIKDMPTNITIKPNIFFINLIFYLLLPGFIFVRTIF